MNRTSITLAVAILGSVVLQVLSFTGILPKELGSPIEVLGVLTGIWSVWLLSRNHPAGWVVGLVMVAAYMWVFYQVELYAEVGIQIFYFFTSLQAIHLWLRGGENHTERPVSMNSRRGLLITVPLVVLAVFGLREVLIVLRGAAPFWDALTTVLSITAHVYLMFRWVQSWLLWITVDIIYVPLYASRGLTLSAGLYAGFLVLAIFGYLKFKREYQRIST